MYKTVKIFTGQDVERNNDVARSIVLRKSNKWDSIGDVFRQKTRQWRLKNRERTPRIIANVRQITGRRAYIIKRERKMFHTNQMKFCTTHLIA